MTRTRVTVCAQPGCPILVEDGTRCPSHAPPRAPDLRPTATARGYDARWRRTRARYLRAHPTCATCTAPAQHVHHLDGLGPKGPRGHDHANLQALCHRCHSRTTAREQPGGWNA